MVRHLFAVVAILPSLLLAQGDHEWALSQATISYQASHPLHESQGVSHAAKGKATCHAGWCDLLVAVPVKSFDSGDSNRDVHMVQSTRGAQFPMVVVRAHVPDEGPSSAAIHADLEIQFAGQTVSYKQVSFQKAAQGSETHITGTIPATLSDFKIEAPRLLSIPIKNEIPIHVDLTWRPL